MDHRTTTCTMETARRPTTGRGRWSVRCCVAAALLAAALPVALGAAPDGQALADMVAGASFLGRYTPRTDVGALAALDLDRRSVVARVGAHTPEGLREAADVYMNGRSYTDGGDDRGSVTLESLSTRAEEELEHSPTFWTFKDYYGSADYADKWIRAAFDGAVTAFPEGNADFREFSEEGRASAIGYATAILNVWMHVVGRVESAASRCSFDEDDNDPRLVEWDAAAALLVGSEATGYTDGSAGHLLFKIIQVECRHFGTCREGELAPVNDSLLDLLVDGQAHLQMGNCKVVKEKAAQIKALATVPLVQGALRAIHEIDRHDDRQETVQGMAAAFAAAVLPLVDACNRGNAVAIHNDLMPGKAPGGSFFVVKDALERSYDCLGIACGDVGGLVNFRGDGFLAGAEACGKVQPVMSDIEYDDQVENDADSADPVSEPQPSVSSNESSVSGGAMSPWFAALLSGLVFGVIGLMGGAAISRACMRQKKMASSAPVTAVNDILRDSDFEDENNII